VVKDSTCFRPHGYCNKQGRKIILSNLPCSTNEEIFIMLSRLPPLREISWWLTQLQSLIQHHVCQNVFTDLTQQFYPFQNLPCLVFTKYLDVYVSALWMWIERMDRLSNNVLIDQCYKISITYMYNRLNSRLNERKKGEGCPNTPVTVICLTPTRIIRNAVWIEVTSHKEEGLKKLQNRFTRLLQPRQV